MYVKEDPCEYLVVPDAPDPLDLVEDGRVELNDVCGGLDGLGSAGWCSVEAKLTYEFEEDDRMLAVVVWLDTSLYRSNRGSDAVDKLLRKSHVAIGA